MTALIYNFTEEKRKREIGKALDDRVSISGDTLLSDEFVLNYIESITPIMPWDNKEN